jgi:hypothetical protein
MEKQQIKLITGETDARLKPPPAVAPKRYTQFFLKHFLQIMILKIFFVFLFKIDSNEYFRT